MTLTLREEMDVTISWCSYVYCEMQVNVSCSKIGRCGGGECILQATGGEISEKEHAICFS